MTLSFQNLNFILKSTFIQTLSPKSGMPLSSFRCALGSLNQEGSQKYQVQQCKTQKQDSRKNETFCCVNPRSRLLIKNKPVKIKCFQVKSSIRIDLSNFFCASITKSRGQYRISSGSISDGVGSSWANCFNERKNVVFNDIEPFTSTVTSQLSKLIWLQL